MITKNRFDLEERTNLSGNRSVKSCSDFVNYGMTKDDVKSLDVISDRALDLIFGQYRQAVEVLCDCEHGHVLGTAFIVGDGLPSLILEDEDGNTFHHPLHRVRKIEA